MFRYIAAALFSIYSLIMFFVAHYTVFSNNSWDGNNATIELNTVMLCVFFLLSSYMSIRIARHLLEGAR